ncbi:MAG: peptidylprolyl isomerase [Pacificimonas sp.]|jgi:peptidylprolyl isomerase|nr:peptidylprolyl isomerase [Pacificimonas sp.]
MRILTLLFVILALPISAAAQQRVVPESVPDENILVLDLSTGGRTTIIMRPDLAPNHVERIRTLANQGFYDGVIFHRVIPGFMAQTGDPLGTGQGGSDLPDLAAEFSTTPHLRGTVSMARAQDNDSANSQFFIVLLPTTSLDENYTVWGRVFDGMPFVSAIAPGEPPAQPDRILQARIGRNVPPPAAPAMAAGSAPAPDAAVADLMSQLPPGAAPSGAAAEIADEVPPDEPTMETVPQVAPTPPTSPDADPAR